MQGTRDTMSGTDVRWGQVCLIMAPTRELALQILSEANKFLDSVKCRAVCCYGGSISPTMHSLWSIRG
eukprot:3611064-Rhodomonas_salina.2